MILSTLKVILFYNNTIIVSNFVLNLVSFQERCQLFSELCRGFKLGKKSIFSDIAYN